MSRWPTSSRSGNCQLGLNTTNVGMRTLLGVDFANVTRLKLLLGQFCLLFHALLVAFSQRHQLL